LTARVDPQGWERDVRPVIPPARRSVWEVSVRDFSQDPASGVHTAWRGKFLAFTQQGTTLSSDGIHPTCLNYLKRLGVSYVQLMPIFDFGSVDESRPLTRQYNWGYDPTNFNVPEGSYSTDPTRGEVRVRECKQMIAALHAAGIGVVMDVVYNHTVPFDNVLNRASPSTTPPERRRFPLQRQRLRQRVSPPSRPSRPGAISIEFGVSTWATGISHVDGPFRFRPS